MYVYECTYIDIHLANITVINEINFSETFPHKIDQNQKILTGNFTKKHT